MKIVQKTLYDDVMKEHHAMNSFSDLAEKAGYALNYLTKDGLSAYKKGVNLLSMCIDPENRPKDSLVISFEGTEKELKTLERVLGSYLN